jgi:hypothetical protein
MKKQNLFTIIVFFIIVIFINSCKRCDGYNEEGLVYMPYKNTEYLVFSDGVDTAIFYLKDVNIDDKYNDWNIFTQRNCYNESAIITFYKSNKFKKNLYFQSSDLFDCDNNCYSYYIEFDNFEGHFGIENNEFFCDTILFDFTLLTKKYDKVIIPFGNESIYNCYFCENIGLVGFYAQDSTLWELIEKK